MKRVISLFVMISIFSTSVMAHYVTERKCHRKRNRWGERVRVCREVERHHDHDRHHSDSDDVVVGIAAGVLAGIILASCAHEASTGNIAATDNTVERLAKDKDFEDFTKFQAITKNIVQTENKKEKLGKYFELLDLKSKSSIADFLKADKDELAPYADKLANKTDITFELATLVVQKVSTSLRGDF